MADVPALRLEREWLVKFLGWCIAALLTLLSIFSGYTLKTVLSTHDDVLTLQNQVAGRDGLMDRVTALEARQARH